MSERKKSLSAPSMQKTGSEINSLAMLPELKLFPQKKIKIKDLYVNIILSFISAELC